MKQLWSLSGCSAALLMMTGVARLARDSRGWPGLETRRQRALAWERRAFYVSLCTSLAFSRIKVVFFFLKEKRLRLLQSLTRSRLLAQKKSAREPYPRGCSRAGHWSQAPIPATALPWVRGLGVSLVLWHWGQQGLGAPRWPAGLVLWGWRGDCWPGPRRRPASCPVHSRLLPGWVQWPQSREHAWEGHQPQGTGRWGAVGTLTSSPEAAGPTVREAAPRLGLQLQMAT